MNWIAHLKRIALSRGIQYVCLSIVSLLSLGLLLQRSSAQTTSTDEPAPIQSLKKVKVPGPTAQELAPVLADRNAAIMLGKALFWDTRVGSDNKTACASCHFNAGADKRFKNQLTPGLLAGDKTFQLGGPNYQLKAADFPFTRHANRDDASTRIADINDIVSSQGVFTETFNNISDRGRRDDCTVVSDAISHGGSGFNINGINTRRVEPRNAPTVINAVFNLRAFWDGRANNMFNGVDNAGLRNNTAQVWKLDFGVLQLKPLSLSSAALASLASGPPLSENEMSCRGRMFAHVGRKLLKQTILYDQQIDSNDSVLGSVSWDRPRYADLVKKAFKSDYWASDKPITLSSQVVSQSIDLAPGVPAASRAASALRSSSLPRDQFTQMEANFALFFGLAVQLYQSTLVSDSTPFDRYAEGNKSALSSQEIRGLTLFRGKAECVHCHSGAEFTSASFSSILDEGRLDSRAGANNTVFRYDNGFFNTGVRPITEDPGVGGVDPFGYPLSDTRMAQLGRYELFGNGFDINNEVPVAPDALTALDGAFKTPGLRNVEFTGPYFHNGGKSTLMQVVDFYNRGGDFAAENQPIPDPTIHPLGLTDSEKNDLVAFLLALSDNRVRYSKAPFDHPSICVPEGHVGTTTSVQADARGNAVDINKCLPAVGRFGTSRALTGFLNLDPFAH